MHNLTQAKKLVPSISFNCLGFWIALPPSFEISGYAPVSDRLLAIRLQGHPINTTVFQVNASTSTANPEEIECFCAELQTDIDIVQGQDTLIIIINMLWVTGMPKLKGYLKR